VDWLDECPESPENAVIDSTGCIPDGDKDGIPDRVDRCPDTPSGLAVDETGCLVMTQLDRKLLLFPDFEPGYVTLDHVSRGILDDLAVRLKDNPRISILIRGYTDNIGEDLANIEISERRAEAARKYLIDRGVSPDRIEAIGLGEIDFIASNDTAAGRKRNRRLEFTFEVAGKTNTLSGDQ
jgi:OOP family OmpA-OmpF porin